MDPGEYYKRAVDVDAKKLVASWSSVLEPKAVGVAAAAQCPHNILSMAVLGLPMGVPRHGLQLLADASALEAGGRWVAEVHPAVALGWWYARQGAGSAVRLPRYKGNDDAVDRVRGRLVELLQPLRALIGPEAWAFLDSDACGAVMRVSPCAFLADGLWQPVSAWQAATTHGGPAAIASALLAAAVLRRVIIATDPQAMVTDGLLRHAIELSRDEALVSAAAPWLIDHPRTGTFDLASDLIRTGMATVREALQQARDVTPTFLADPWIADPSLPDYGGEGWRSPQALACGLLCVDMLPGEPVEALRRAATTGGDSDTIAAIAGYFLGGVYGNVWPSHWLIRLEPRYAMWIIDAEVYAFD
jgi:ADP-ribosylglycohydrolase